MPLQHKKPQWWGELKRTWEANRQSTHYVPTGSEPNVDGLTAKMFKAQLWILYRKTQALEFFDALEKLEYLELVTEKGNWARVWRRPYDDMLDDAVCQGIHKELQYLEPRCPIHPFTGADMPIEVQQNWARQTSARRPASITLACARTAAFCGTAAPSFEAAIKSLERRYRKWLASTANTPHKSTQDCIFVAYFSFRCKSHEQWRKPVQTLDRLLSLAEASPLLGMKNTAIYACLKDRSLQAVKVGSRTFIAQSEIARFRASLPTIGRESEMPSNTSGAAR